MENLTDNQRTVLEYFRRNGIGALPVKATSQAGQWNQAEWIWPKDVRCDSELADILATEIPHCIVGL